MSHEKYIQEVNRMYLNILGLRLVPFGKDAYKLEEENSPGSFDGCLLTSIDATYAEEVKREWSEHAAARQGRLGFTVQPTDYKPKVKKAALTKKAAGEVNDGK